MCAARGYFGANGARITVGTVAVDKLSYAVVEIALEKNNPFGGSNPGPRTVEREKKGELKEKEEK